MALIHQQKLFSSKEDKSAFESPIFQKIKNNEEAKGDINNKNFETPIFKEIKNSETIINKFNEKTFETPIVNKINDIEVDEMAQNESQK